MTRAGRTLSRITLPLRSVVERFAFGTVIVLSVGLLVLSKAEMRAVDFVNERIGDVFTPMLALMTEPVAATRRAAAEIGELFALREENRRLREQNRRLLTWQSEATRLSVENAALREALNVANHPVMPTATTARVVADAGGPFVHTLLLDAGEAGGVVDGMAAMSSAGLVGRVINVGRNSSRVLMLTDFNSRVPVLVEPSRDHAILAGNNTTTPLLTFLPLNPRLQVGDRIVTSGRGGLLPPGLAVGRITAIEDERVEIATYVDWQRIDFVRLLHYPKLEKPETSGARSAEGPSR